VSIVGAFVPFAFLQCIDVFCEWRSCSDIVERRRASVVAGDGGQYALRDFLRYVGSVEIIIFSFFLGKVGKQTKKNCLFWGLFVIDRTLLSMIE
jgi:hypothetical protein